MLRLAMLVLCSLVAISHAAVPDGLEQGLATYLDDAPMAATGRKLLANNFQKKNFKVQKKCYQKKICDPKKCHKVAKYKQVCKWVKTHSGKKKVCNKVKYYDTVCKPAKCYYKTIC